jgi:hypothetical protein
MTSSSRYPFADLPQAEIQRIIRSAKAEQASAIRSFVASLFRVRRGRETQVWPPNNVPALSLKTYC